MPPSRWTSARSPTAWTTAGNCSSGVGARSSCRPPWFETTTASAPASTTALASSALITPFTISAPGQASRSELTSVRVADGSKTRSTSSATVPPQDRSEANSRGSVVSRSNHQRGCRAALVMVRMDSAGGMVKPLRTSRSRGPATGVSTVRTRASYPEARARSTSAALASRSRQRYSWNQRRAPGAAAASASIEVVPMVESAYGTPIRSATRATAGSPSVCMSRVNPVGAKAKGSADAAPSTVVAGSTTATSRSTLGQNSTRSKAARERRRLISAPAAPSVYSKTARGTRRRAISRRSATVAALASLRSLPGPAGRRGRISSSNSDQRGIRRSTTVPPSPHTGDDGGPIGGVGVAAPPCQRGTGTSPGRLRSVDPGGAHGQRLPARRFAVEHVAVDGRFRCGRGRLSGRLSRVRRRGQPARPPAQHVLEPGAPVPGPAGAGQLVPLPREQQQLGRDSAALELDVEPGTLLHRAAPVLLGVDDHRRRGDPRGVRHRALGGDPLRIGAEVLVGENPPDVRGTHEAHRFEERPLGDRSGEPRGAADQ